MGFGWFECILRWNSDSSPVGTLLVVNVYLKCSYFHSDTLHRRTAQAHSTGTPRRHTAQTLSATIIIPGHALHEKGSQRQIGVGTQVSSQERKALFVPLINRG